MKYVLIIGDGIADEPVEQLGGKTPLAAIDCPNMNILAGGRLGLCQTVPHGVAPGSDTAILSIFGYDPRTCYTGRSALEAAGMGVIIKPGETSLRVNLCAIEGDSFDTAKILVTEYKKQKEKLHEKNHLFVTHRNNPVHHICR